MRLRDLPLEELNEIEMQELEDHGESVARPFNRDLTSHQTNAETVNVQEPVESAVDLSPIPDVAMLELLQDLVDLTQAGEPVVWPNGLNFSSASNLLCNFSVSTSSHTE